MLRGTGCFGVTIHVEGRSDAQLSALYGKRIAVELRLQAGGLVREGARLQRWHELLRSVSEHLDLVGVPMAYRGIAADQHGCLIVTVPGEVAGHNIPDFEYVVTARSRPAVVPTDPDVNCERCLRVAVAVGGVRPVSPVDGRLRVFRLGRLGCEGLWWL